VSSGREDVGEGVLDVLLALSDVLPFVSGGVKDVGGVVNVFTPDIVKPFVQGAMNRSWTGGRIYNEWSDGSLPGFRSVRRNRMGEVYSPSWLVEGSRVVDMWTGGDGTSGGVVSMNPDKVDHYLRGYFNGLYVLGSRTLDVVYKGLVSSSSSEDDVRVRVRDIPFVNRFYASEADLSMLPADVSRRYYKLREDVHAAGVRYRDYEERMARGEAIEGVEAKMGELERILMYKDGVNDVEWHFRNLGDAVGEDRAWKEQELRFAVDNLLKSYYGGD
jgi:hypothetical protein